MAELRCAYVPVHGFGQSIWEECLRPVHGFAAFGLNRWSHEQLLRWISQGSTKKQSRSTRAPIVIELQNIQYLGTGPRSRFNGTTSPFDQICVLVLFGDPQACTSQRLGIGSNTKRKANLVNENSHKCVSYQRGNVLATLSELRMQAFSLRGRYAPPYHEQALVLGDQQDSGD